MAILFMDGFDNYYTIQERWPFWWNAGPNGGATHHNYSRHASALSRGAAPGDGNSTRGTVRSLGANYTTLVYGIAICQNSTWAAGYVMFGFEDGYNGGTLQMYCVTNGDGKIRVYNGQNTLLGTTTNAVGLGWSYYELKVTFDSTSSGTYDLHVNGESWLSGSGRTTGTANNYANAVMYAGLNGQAYWDDVYVLDNTGTNNDFLGDVRVEGLFPSGNGNSSMLVGSDGNSTDNYLLVDELTTGTGGSDNDGTYVEGANVNDKDTYAFADLTNPTGTVYGVQIQTVARKNDAGPARKITSISRLSSTEDVGSDHLLSVSYNPFYDIHETKPGGGAWTVTDVNSAEFGVKVTG